MEAVAIGYSSPPCGDKADVLDLPTEQPSTHHSPRRALDKVQKERSYYKTVLGGLAQDGEFTTVFPHSSQLF